MRRALMIVFIAMILSAVVLFVFGMHRYVQECRPLCGKYFARGGLSACYCDVPAEEMWRVNH